MCQPRFEVGEVVILQSVNLPHHNGEYTIEAIFYPGEILPNGTRLKADETFGYYLGFIADSGRPTWRECAIRKRQEPGEYSFEGLKTILKMPVDRLDFA